MAKNLAAATLHFEVSGTHSHLHFHGPELRAPPDVRGVGTVTRGGRLPTDCLPVRALDAFEVFRLLGVVYFFYASLEDNEGVPNEQVSDVLRQTGVGGGG